MVPGVEPAEVTVPRGRARGGSARDRWLRILAIGAIAGVSVVAYQTGLLDPDRVRELMVGAGPLAPVVWILLYLVAVFIPLGTTVMTVAAGLAFGTLAGTALTWMVTLGASLLPFFLARSLARNWFEQRVENTRLSRTVDLINGRSFWVVFYLRLVPSLPYEIQNYVAGLTRIRVTHFVLATALGIGPILFILAFLGDSLQDVGSPRFLVAAVLYGVALTAPPVVAWIWSTVRGRQRSRDAQS